MKNRYRYNKKAGALQDAFEQSSAPAAPMPASESLYGLSEQAAYDYDDASISAPIHFSNMSSLAPPPPPQQFQSAFRESVDASTEMLLPAQMLGNIAHGAAQAAPPAMRVRRSAVATRGAGGEGDNGLDRTQAHQGIKDMFYYTVEDGQRILLVEKDGSMSVVQGPARVWRRGKQIRQMQHYVAHPGDFLIVRYRDGQQEHLTGPAHVWFDPREHMAITKEESLPISAKEAVVVYSEDEETDEISRRIVHGPAQFVPKPGEWLHTFSWHGSAPGVGGYQKVPNALQFQKLWLMPDQMYHDVTDVRTADDAVLTIRLMIFFELRDIEKMLETTHDPIGDFINAATSDVIEFMSRHDFESFKRNTEKLNDLATYKQLSSRAEQCGYYMDKVVYRGYGAPARLQKMHDEAIESRTRLGLERATEQQAQELEDFKLDRKLARDEKLRVEQRDTTEHELQMASQRRDAELLHQRKQREFAREQATQDAVSRREEAIAQQEAQRAHLEALRELGVDLTALLTHSRADKIIELRGSDKNGVAPHLHIDQ